MYLCVGPINRLCLAEDLMLHGATSLKAWLISGILTGDAAQGGLTPVEAKLGHL